MHGFTLIEVLVAIVIFSLGLLGMAGMQAAALQANREARTHGLASSLARELAEMMRGNHRIAIQTAETSNPYLGDFSVGALQLPNPSYCLSVANAGTGCTTTASVASAQMTEWLARVNAALPGARVRVCFDSAPYDDKGMPRWECDDVTDNAIISIKIGWTQASTDRTRAGADAYQTADGEQSRPQLSFPVTTGSPA